MDTAGRIRFGGLVAGLSLSLALTPTFLRGIAAPVLYLSLVVTVLVGEVLLPRPERVRRNTATLEVRRIRDFAPRAALRGVVALAIVFAVLGAVAAVLAGTLAGTIRVYGGWGLMGVLPSIAVVLAIGTLTAWAGLRLVARAPRAGGADEPPGDNMWRRRTTATIIAADGVLASVSVIGAVAAIGYFYSGAIAVLGPVAVLAVLSLGWYSIMLVRPVAADPPPQASAPPGAQPAATQRVAQPAADATSIPAPVER